MKDSLLMWLLIFFYSWKMTDVASHANYACIGAETNHRITPVVIIIRARSKTQNTFQKPPLTTHLRNVDIQNVFHFLFAVKLD